MWASLFFLPHRLQGTIVFDSAGESNQYFARKRRLDGGPDKSTSQAKRKFSLSEEEEEEEEEEFIDEEVMDEDEGLAGNDHWRTIYLIFLYKVSRVKGTTLTEIHC